MGKRTLSIGKMRGLRQISDENDLLLILAMDHRDNLRRALAPDAPESVDAREMVEVKEDLCRALSPHASAVLLDPEYSYAQLTYLAALPGSTGALVAVEKTGYSGDATERRTELLPDLGVAKLKAMGVSGIKLLVYYHPDARNASEQQDVVAEVAEACRQEDILCVLETLSYPTDPRLKKSSPEFAREKADIVVRTAEQLTASGIDIYKTEFPGDLEFGQDEATLLTSCQRLDAASRVPWAILSEGVSFTEFCKEVEIAGKAGASGFIVGRAVWQEAITRDRRERQRRLQEQAVPNLKRLVAVARAHCRPWSERIATSQVAAQLEPDWFRVYRKI